MRRLATYHVLYRTSASAHEYNEIVRPRHFFEWTRPRGHKAHTRRYIFKRIRAQRALGMLRPGLCHIPFNTVFFLRFKLPVDLVQRPTRCPRRNVASAPPSENEQYFASNFVPNGVNPQMHVVHDAAINHPDSGRSWHLHHCVSVRRCMTIVRSMITTDITARP
jgi:hypothetical protein